MQLQIHERQRFLHVLDVSGRIIQQPFPMAQIGSQGGYIAAKAKELARSKPQACRRCNHCASLMSLLRPGTERVSRALATMTSRPALSRTSKTGIQYTPVDSMATVSMPTANPCHPLNIASKRLESLDRLIG
jgi:hypothetical protein